MKRRLVVVIVILLVAGFGTRSKDTNNDTKTDSLGGWKETLTILEEAITTASKVSARVEEPSRPQRLIIPAIRVNAPVVAMGVTPEGRMAVPDNYTHIGWYGLGTRPGTIGSAVMGAHVDNGGRISGVFKKLQYLKKGNIIQSIDTHGATSTFKITSIKVYNYRTPVTNDVFLSNDKARLNLITCYGTWLPKENTYNKRLIVFAELVTPQVQGEQESGE
ncbi:class F sortase [Patescibacteria group bacterium]|nr:class F sortase [Patescibacteria group bacterium]